MSSWLYRYEVKGIQSWILASDRLAELRGGSAVVEGLAALAEQRARGAEVLYAAAGGGTLRFPDQASLTRFASTWPLVLSRVAPGLQVVQAWARDKDELYAQLGAARNRPRADLPEAGPWTARASRTGMPAVGRFERVLEDAGTRRRRTASRGSDGKALGPERIFEDPLSERVSAVRFERDVHDRCWEGHPIAVIHADGNGIGRIVMGKSPEQMKAFSAALTDASHRAARRAVEALTHAYRQSDEPKDHDIPARPVVIGGDDFTFLVRGDLGLPFLDAWLRAFEEETRRPELGGGLTACGGVAFVRIGFPFAQAHEIAESLCKAAKHRLRDAGPGGAGRSGLAFARITTSLRDEAANSGVYDLDELRALLDDTRRAQRLPRGKLRTWIELADAGERDRAAQLWARTGEIAQADAAARAAFDQLASPDSARRRRVADALSWLQLSRRPELWGNA